MKACVDLQLSVLRDLILAALDATQAHPAADADRKRARVSLAEALDLLDEIGTDAEARPNLCHGAGQAHQDHGA